MRDFCAKLAILATLFCSSAFAQRTDVPEQCKAFPALPVVEKLPGESEFRLIAKLRDGRAVGLELFVVKGYADRSANRAAISALETHLRDQVRCPGIRELRYRVAMSPGASELLEMAQAPE